MALIIKPRTLGLLTKTERRAAGASFIVSAFGLFDLAEPDPYRLQGDQAMWIMAAKELPPGAVFDLGMPKPTAEVLIAGHAAAIGGEPVQRMGLAWAIGNLQKQLLVTGDRVWRMAGATAVPTEPQPFVQMPLVPQRCFGGEGHGSNPAGVGFKAQERLMARETVPLPNIETPELAIRSIGDAPPPPRFGPMAVDAKERLQYAGTYDDHWIKNLAPALAEDADPRLFLFAPPDQRLPRHLEGNEGYGLRNFAADAPEIQQHLPGFRVRCFIGWTDPQKPIAELPMRIDTLWFFAGARRGVMIYRGATPVEDIEAADIADVMLAYERMGEEPRPLSHYLQVRALRTNPETAFKYAFSEHQLTPAVPQAEIDRREALRRERSAERRRKQRENSEWVIREELARSGLPRELWPAIEVPEPEDDGLVLPLPEEIASGELDLAEMLDALEAVQAAEEAKLDATVEAQQPIMEAMNQIASGQAEPETIDRLLAMLDQPDMAAQIDAEIAQLPSRDALPGLPAGTETDEALKALDGVKDWRQALLDAAKPDIDETEQFQQARARFLSLPEGCPLELVRKLIGEDNLPTPDLPDFASPQPAVEDEPGMAALDAALAALENGGAPPEAAERVRGALQEAESKLSAMLPGLAAIDGSPLQALIAQGGSSQPPPADAGQTKALVADTLGQMRETVEATLASSEAQLLAGFAAMRLASPTPLKPDQPLTPAVARALGELVVQQSRAGLVLAGRDFAGADLSGQDLSGVDLTGAFLERARLDNASLRGAILTRTTLAGASLRGADLSGCDLTDANLGEIDGEDARFDGARVVNTMLMGAKLGGASFAGAELSRLILMAAPLNGASFAQAHLHNVTFMQCGLADTDWRGATVERCQLADCQLERARFAGATLSEVGFLLAKAAQADFSEARLSSVMFAGDVDLRQSRFDGVAAAGLVFQKADLAEADFARGRFERLCLVETRMTNASFRLASLKRGLFSRNDLVSTDFFGADLLEAQFNRADLSGASLRAANLFGADLMDATLFGADFSRANLSRTILAVASDVG